MKMTPGETVALATAVASATAAAFWKHLAVLARRLTGRKSTRAEKDDAAGTLVRAAQNLTEAQDLFRRAQDDRIQHLETRLNEVEAEFGRHHARCQRDLRALLRKVSDLTAAVVAAGLDPGAPVELETDGA
jgi:uncharacterized coiled-coil protein SlyX